MSSEFYYSQSLCYVAIIEQPKAAVFFDEFYNGFPGEIITGVNSTPDNKTFPTIKIHRYHGRALGAVSCVTKDFPYRVHPNYLLGDGNNLESGACLIKFDSDSMTCSFPNMLIERVRQEDIKILLGIRQKKRFDPFKNGFDHRYQPNNIDLNAVRLAFQVFLESSKEGKFNIPLVPIVSEPIFDKTAERMFITNKVNNK